MAQHLRIRCAVKTGRTSAHERIYSVCSQSEGGIGSPLIEGTAGGCRSCRVLAKTWASETGDVLLVNMPPSGMKVKNICSEAVGGDYAGADWPI